MVSVEERDGRKDKTTSEFRDGDIVSPNLFSARMSKG